MKIVIIYFKKSIVFGMICFVILGRVLFLKIILKIITEYYCTIYIYNSATNSSASIRDFFCINHTCYL